MQGGFRLFDHKENETELEISPEVKPLLRAWILLHSSYSSGGFLAKKRQAKDLEEFMNEFHLKDVPPGSSPNEELQKLWSDFFETIITMNSEDKNYASTIFGMVSMKNSNLYTKIASEILVLTKEFPNSVLDDQKALYFAPLCDCGKNIFCQIFKNGEQYWAQAEQL